MKVFPEGRGRHARGGRGGQRRTIWRCCSRSAQRTRVLASLGDCAITGNVTALRNVWPVEAVLHTAYVERATRAPQMPDEPGIMPRLTPRVVPLHHVVPVDAYIPGCPPDADRIWRRSLALLHGEPVRAVDAPAAKFG